MRERRLAERTKVAGRKGLVLHGDITARCDINDVSATGASLTFDYARVLPSRFKLRFLEDGHEETAQVVWRRGAVAGVSFSRPLEFSKRAALPMAPF